ncbi:2-keto-4-pentenoate hydratase/2-oxohepta-3-ene-1,7-dioic acid hydratase in catechol pathway [Clostridium algifaecis]|uniref:2-keto-4-pentenoate hydratase/2-oxohepta-3-ene-1,7-dioic acid hydratase in catechol pathway n=1 Tax=Clostridium algifaecis TaxID=1472040 RepID=A0ABS4KUG6_9CLOT|nr:fumarylacetoacetate hydrolase family protein [Clostridium algifaecis]MBP2033692.1 2-keto-4-pentenoate hydratase/2-oxohepta-3-ene-1,7-dioic acid hydratase in catechol pathway [Clostridium algifaecis]
MKLITYLKGKEEKIGVLKQNSVVDIKCILKKMGEKNLPESMIDFIKYSDDCKLKKIDEFLKNEDIEADSLDSVKIEAPIPYPERNVFCLGKNYVEHAREVKLTRITGTDIPKQPIYFTKVASPAIGNGDFVKFSTKVTKQVDYEAELAVIIGKEGINIKAEEAEDYIFGYTIINDVSARDLQGKHVQWFKGKSLDTFCPMGPCIVNKSDIPFPVELNIGCKVNGEVRQKSNTKKLIFDIPYIISDLSKGLTLKPGDIISTGTPNGVGMGFNPIKILKNGDVVECFIEGIGTLTNKILEI